jgi:hypothetical protein
MHIVPSVLSVIKSLLNGLFCKLEGLHNSSACPEHLVDITDSLSSLE